MGRWFFLKVTKGMKATTIRIKQATIERLKRLGFKRNENSWDDSIRELLDKHEAEYGTKRNNEGGVRHT